MTDAVARATPSTATRAAVSCTGLGVRLGDAAIISGLDLSVAAGSWTTIIGPNGAGKSTLLRALSGLVDAEGEICIDGAPLGAWSPRRRARHLATVPQHPVWPPGMAVIDYVLLGRAAHQTFRVSASEHDVATVHALLQRLDLDALGDRAVDTLSGGERQRTAIARALAQEAPLLLLDEPSSALDIGHQIEVLELLDELRHERGLTVLSTLHDLSLAGQFSERIALLVDGAIVADGEPAEVLTSDLIGRHYGAEVRIHHETDGAVTVSVRRRREGTP
ncbi:MAG: ABC transporter ATP-binding protein [Actinomycetota bacterium]